LKKLSKENTSIFKLITIDGGEQTELTNQLKVDAFPTFIIYKKGKEVWRQQGIVSYETLLNQLK
jgi:thioredoxin-like negative regulator of GroEL